MNARGAANDQPAPETRDPTAALRDLPDELWPGLMELLRRTFDDLDPGVVPRRLRPFVNWHPDRLDRQVVRSAVIASLPEDARLRHALAGQIAAAEPELAASARDGDVERLAEAFEPGAVAAALIGHERWDALEILSARHTERRRADRAAEPAPAPSQEDSGPSREALAEEVRRRDKDIRELRQDLDRADRRGEVLSRTVSELRGELADVWRERDNLSAELDQLRSRHRERLARLRRQARRAREHADDREARVRALAHDLRTMLEGLIEAPAAPPSGVAPDRHAPAPDGAAEAVSPAGTRTPEVPRGVRAAEPGRPCRLPPGMIGESAAAVVALLQVPGLELLVDGYNVTKDLRGRPNAPLPQQRRWLLRTMAGLCALYPVRPTIVFDGGDEHAGTTPSPRGVRAVFTSTDESADDRIMRYVEGMAADVPVLVVTSDREIRDHATQLGANVVSSSTFLKGIGVAA